MTITKKELDRIIHLAHLDVSEERRLAYVSQVNDILTHMEQLNDLNLDNIPPSAHARIQETLLREDVAVSQDHLHLEKNAPAWEDNAFRVPKILGDGA